MFLKVNQLLAVYKQPDKDHVMVMRVGNTKAEKLHSVSTVQVCDATMMGVVP